MRYYHRTEQDLLDTAYWRCHRDAGTGRIPLALSRLEDLRDEFPRSGHPSYAEGLIRIRWLGQGVDAISCFERAAEREPALMPDIELRFGGPDGLNAVRRQLDPETISSEMEGNGPARLAGDFWKGLADRVPSDRLTGEVAAEGEIEAGEVAAHIETVLRAGGQAVPSETRAKLVRKRVECLRALDANAEQRLRLQGEIPLPEDRLALRQALAELLQLVADETGASHYDAELWNFAAAWSYLLEQYDAAIEYAERALLLRPTRYCLPWLNKALALSGLRRDQEAGVALRRAITEGEASGDAEHLAQVRNVAARGLGIDRTVLSQSQLETLVQQVIHGAGDLAHREISAHGGRLENVASSLAARAQAIGPHWHPRWVTALAELLSFYSPEAATFVTIAAAGMYPPALENTTLAAVHLCASETGIVGRDATRFLTLGILGTQRLPAMKQMYRQLVLGVSEVGSGPFTAVRERVGAEIARINPQLRKELEAQAPLDSDERREIRDQILSKLESGPPPEFWGDDPSHGEKGARKPDRQGVRGDVPSTKDTGEATHVARIRCMVAGAFVGVVMSSFAFAPLLKFFVGGGSMRAVVPPELRSSLVVALVMWAIIPGATWGFLVGAFTPPNRQVGPLSSLAGALSGLCGVCCAWASQWQRVRQLQSGPIAEAMLMSVGLLLVIAFLVTQTVGPAAERLIRGK